MNYIYASQTKKILRIKCEKRTIQEMLDAIKSEKLVLHIKQGNSMADMEFKEFKEEDW